MTARVWVFSPAPAEMQDSEFIKSAPFNVIVVLLWLDVRAESLRISI
jgi:hypothetical protein